MAVSAIFIGLAARNQVELVAGLALAHDQGARSEDFRLEPARDCDQLVAVQRGEVARQIFFDDLTI
jgi:hypothetical protein